VNSAYGHERSLSGATRGVKRPINQSLSFGALILAPPALDLNYVTLNSAAQRREARVQAENNR
jgi:hypothetical protein